MESDHIPLKSGVSRSYRSAFFVEEDSLRRFQAILTKAGAGLSFPAMVVFHVEREDDRFYETENVDDVLSDHNLPHKRVVALSVELRRKGQSASPWEEDWIARVGFGAERRYRSLALEVNRVSFAIANPDRSWALLLADELEPQVVRTLRGPRIGGWLIYPATVLIATGLVALGDSLSDQVTLLQTFQRPPSLFKMIGTSVGSLFLVWMFRSVEPLSSLMLPRWIWRLAGTESTFFWGEEARLYPQRERLRRNLFWGGVVAFFASLAAGIVLLILQK